MSEKIQFEKLNNTRDLGGTLTKDGRVIKRGRLIRSGHLYHATERDCRKIEKTVGLVIDLRTGAERIEKPDPELAGVEYLHAPAFDSLTAGVTRDARSDEAVFEFVARSPESARAYMMKTYLGFVTGEQSAACYKTFAWRLARGCDGAILWHCTAGKDRTGFATAIVLEALGVDREEIFDDYMATNDYIVEERRRLYDMVRERFGDDFEKYEKSLGYLFSPQREYLEAVYSEAETRWGSFDAYLETVLGVTDEVRDRLKETYLEPQGGDM